MVLEVGWGISIGEYDNIIMIGVVGGVRGVASMVLCERSVEKLSGTEFSI